MCATSGIPNAPFDRSLSAVPSTYQHTNSLPAKLCATSGIPDAPFDTKSLSRGKKSSPTTTLKESTNQPANPNRFAKPITSPEREKAAKGVIPATQKPVLSGLFVLSMPGYLIAPFWTLARLSPTIYWPELVSKWVCRFLLETRKSDGSPYPPASLRSLVCGLNRVLQKNKAPFSVLDKADHRFRDIL